MRLFENLLPDTVSAAVARPPMWETPLGPDEEQFIATAGDKRKRDFRAGRHCAKAALGALGGPADAVIGVGERRQPLWPPGYCGSISHTRGHCVAVAGRGEDYRAMGIDIEQATPLKEDVLHMICTPTERKALSGVEKPLSWAKVIFSIKEAIYKAHYPLCGVFFGFQDAEVLLDARGGIFTASIDRQKDALVFATQGSFATDSEIVAAFVSVPARTPAAPGAT
ncbi:MAG: 4'-phosphopantetheinyl transferase superfamily protein [Pseudomonadota bacterium]